MKEKPTVGSFMGGVFPSDCILKVTKDVKVHFFIHSFTFMDELIMIPANSRNFLKLLRNTNYEKNVLYYILITVYKIRFSERVV